MLLSLLNRRISSSIGLIIIFLFAIFSASAIIRRYKSLMKVKIEIIGLETPGNSK